MKNFLVGAILLFSISSSYAEEVDPNIALIQNSFEAFLKNFIARDAVGLATHFQFPSINQLTNPSSVFHTKEEFIKFWESFPLQDGYAYRRRTAQKSIAYQTPSITQTSIILATTMLTNSFMKEAVSIFMEKKQVAGKYFFNGQETESKLS